jgi:3-hydroxyisobutyrate dehydrogenase-like beta-hydroxyacid dehydrogenase
VTKLGIIGLGYVGLPLAVAFASEGCEVIAVDVDARKVDAIAAGDSYIEDVPSEVLARLADRIHPSTRYAGLAQADAVIICVPTPLTRSREPDLGPLVESARALAEVLQPGQLVVLESTTYPGTTRERLAPLLEESGLAAGRGFHLAFSPERVDPGRTDYTLRNTPKVLGGLTDACVQRAEALYGIVCDELVRVSTPEAAELTKLLENIFRSVNIALVNELAMLTDRMGIDIWEVVDAASTKPYGFMRFEPGPGMGGARRQLQAGRRRHPRSACAEDHRAAARDGRGRALPRPARAQPRRVRAVQRRPRRGHRRRRPDAHRDRASERRPRPRRPHGALGRRLARRDARVTRRQRRAPVSFVARPPRGRDATC